MNFENYITKENVQKVLDELKSENFLEILKENITNPFLLFLKDLNNDNKLSTIENSEGHTTIFSYHWNRFIKEKIDLEHINHRAATFIEPILFRLTFQEKDVDEAYSKIVEKINSGNFEYYELYHDICECSVCSEKMKLSVNNWKLKFLSFEKLPDGSINFQNLTTPESCLPNINYQVDVFFPTGELVITDWPRIQEFTKHVEVPSEKRYNEFSLNHALGRKNTTEYFAQKFNFISVSLSNISTNAYLDNGNIIIGTEKYDEETDDFTEVKDLEYAANICTDFWGATIIDKQQLIDIITQATGDAKNAETIVNEYIDEYLDGETVQVEPGNYTLSFNPMFENFKELDLTYSDKMDVYFTVKKQHKPVNKIKL